MAPDENSDDSVRNPTCLIVTSAAGLAGRLDKPAVERALGEIREAAERLPGRGIRPTVYVPDRPELAAGIPLADGPLTPEGLAGAIRTLEQGLGQGRSHFTYLLLVGGGDVVPFWRSPNPAADSDSEFPTDAPYAVIDSAGGADAWLVPDRAVGRLPLVSGLDRLFAPCGEPVGQPFGLSAEIWKEQTRKVYQLLSDEALLTSPPLDLDGFKSQWLAAGAVLYFNVHGSKDERYWYGQQGLVYPQVLSPEIVARARPRGSLVVAEACYGGLVEGREPEASIALQFLAQGAAALVGSSAISYGSPVEGLSEADLLAFLFLKRVAGGEPFGDALVEAKTDFAAEMLRRQGYLDGDDKKTLLEFNLFGDPCARLARPEHGKGGGAMIPEDIVEAIKRLVSARFPEMEGVEPELAEETKSLDGNLARKVMQRRPQPTPKGAGPRIEHRVFVASFVRQVATGGREVERVVRITFDERGEVLKIVTSK